MIIFKNCKALDISTFLQKIMLRTFISIVKSEKSYMYQSNN